ncbi:unnamed protein product [Paramecium pentaurelia]|uniref:Uncharacterized protein n=1 Tax=Paramecium pentaurelia TaxID=43138 RepID=A0A8S1VD00_9CILI|nr:unnamed protein product [Paramecium pentaurelia]
MNSLFLNQIQIIHRLFYLLIIIFGYEYQDILLNVFDHKIPIFDFHPEEIYQKPKNGYLYFLRSSTLNNISFPRLKDNSKKLFKWKKMNLQTLLPKNQPLVSYIVCSTDTNNPHFRMHIVQSYNQHDKFGTLLCHVRQITNSILSTQKLVTPSYQIYEDIRNCKQSLTNCMEKSFEITLEVQQIQLRLSLFDDDYNYLQQKFYTLEQREEIIKLKSNLIKQNEICFNELKECEDVLHRYDSFRIVYIYFLYLFKLYILINLF